MRYSIAIITAVILGFTLFSCDPGPKGPQDPPIVKPEPPSPPAFNADSAYNYVAKQVDFGPRVMNSEGHEACKEWLVAQFKSYGATVIEQNFTAKAYTGTTLNGTNVIAQFNPEMSDRIVLAAHWDTRHIADSPLNDKRVDEPILGADDGGSGVGVLLEIARQLQAKPISLGVDIVLFDAEDYGESGEGAQPDSYALGSQYWSNNLHTSYKHRYGILLDMVGSKGAKFPVESWSYKFAQTTVEKVWKLAGQMGYSDFFVPTNGGGITDDHYYVNTIADIPMIDVINLPRASEEVAFGTHWHTHGDDMSIIDKRTLKVVGQVMLAVIYRENAGKF